MLPTLSPGDRVLVRYAAPVRPGALVLVRFADGTLAVKRATERRTTATGDPAWWVLSDNPTEGVDSRHRGPVREADVLAVVLGRTWLPKVLTAPRSSGSGRPPRSRPAATLAGSRSWSRRRATR